MEAVRLASSPTKRNRVSFHEGHVRKPSLTLHDVEDLAVFDEDSDEESA
jgi:hypothetical protein